MTLRFRLPGGTLKIKRYPELRDTERKKEVPVVSIGGVYFVWWSRSAARRERAPMQRTTSSASHPTPDDWQQYD